MTLPIVANLVVAGGLSDKAGVSSRAPGRVLEVLMMDLALQTISI